MAIEYAIWKVGAKPERLQPTKLDELMALCDAFPRGSHSSVSLLHAILQPQPWQH